MLARKAAGWKYLNFVSVQRLAHAVGEYLLLQPETRIGRNGVQSSVCWYELLANQGIAISYDSRQNSYQFAQIFASIFQRYYKQIRTYIIPQAANTPFVSFYTLKFQCVLGIFLTGGDAQPGYSGVKIFNEHGVPISSQET